MAHEIRVPRLGWSMEEGTFVGWLKSDGDPVKVGEPLFDLEGEKATQSIESLDAGILRIAPNAPAPGDVVPVGALLGHLTPAGAPVPPNLSKPTAPPSDLTALKATTDPPASPSARRLARELGVPLSAVGGSGRSGRITPEDIRAAAPSARPASSARAGRPPSTPRARRLASELGVDWRAVPGTGAGGRIRERDVRASAELRPNSGGSATVVALSPRRHAIATRMRASRRRTVAVTLTTTADATNLVSLRAQFKTRGDGVPVPAFVDIFAGLAARVLKSHRYMAARWDAAAERLLLPGDDGLHVGVAVNTDQGLLVPVIRDVANLTLPQVSEHSRVLFDRARRGRLTEPEMSGGVFTITNLGNFGVEGFTPVINYPETAILGLGTIRREPVVLEDDHIVPRDRIAMSLTFDHCRVDGAPAARFLQELRTAAENPAAWLL